MLTTDDVEFTYFISLLFCREKVKIPLLLNVDFHGINIVPASYGNRYYH